MPSSSFQITYSILQRRFARAPAHEVFSLFIYWFGYRQSSLYCSEAQRGDDDLDIAIAGRSRDLDWLRLTRKWPESWLWIVLQAFLPAISNAQVRRQPESSLIGLHHFFMHYGRLINDGPEKENPDYFDHGGKLVISVFMRQLANFYVLLDRPVSSRVQLYQASNSHYGLWRSYNHHFTDVDFTACPTT